MVAFGNGAFADRTESVENAMQYIVVSHAISVKDEYTSASFGTWLPTGRRKPQVNAAPILQWVYAV